MSGIYLTLVQGIGDVAKSPDPEEVQLRLRNSAEAFRRQFEQSEEYLSKFQTDIDLHTAGRYGKAFEAESILCKFYDSRALPTDAEFLGDLETLPKAYDHLIDHASADR
jgi:hypothetical protein